MPVAMSRRVPRPARTAAVGADRPSPWAVALLVLSTAFALLSIGLLTVGPV